MALNLPDFLNARPMQNDYSGMRDLFANYNKGYEGAQMPARMALERSLLEANTKKAQQPEIGSLARDLQDLQRMRQVAPDSPETKLMERLMEAKAQGSNGVSFNFDPSTGGFSAKVGGTPGDIQSAAGKSSFYTTTDANGKQTVVTPPTPQTVNALQEKQIASKSLQLMQPVIQSSPYLGVGADKDMSADIAQYHLTGDKGSLERLARFRMIQKLIPEAAPLTLKSTGSPNIESAYNHALESLTTGFPRYDKSLENNMPQAAIQLGNKMYEDFMRDYGQKTSQFVVGGQPFELTGSNPKSAAYNQTTMQKNGQDINKKLTPIKLNGKKYNIPLNLVEKFMNENPEAHREQ